MDVNFLERVVDCAIAIQSIPAPTFGEAQRAAYVKEQFTAEGLEADQDEAGNIYARLPGQGSASPLIVSAHLDTVFPAEQDLQVRRTDDRVFGPGLGDNSLGVAGLFGLLWALRARRSALPGDLWLVANVGEEGLGDLCGMRAVVDRFGDTPRAYIILEGLALGQIYHRGLAVKRYGITVKTPGGHSWVNYGQPSAVHILAGLIGQITSLSLPRRPRTTLNVGVISGGTTVNTIAAEARLELDLRSESETALEALARQVERLVTAANRPHVAVQAQVIGLRPGGGVPDKHPLVKLARRALEAQQIAPTLGVGSTDANIPLSRGLPAVCVGISTGGGAHTRDEYIFTQPIRPGLESLVALVESAFREL